MGRVQRKKVKNVQTKNKMSMNSHSLSDVISSNIKVKRKIKRKSKTSNRISINNTPNTVLNSSDTIETIEIIDNSFVIDKLGNIKTKSSKVTMPNITNHNLHITDTTDTHNKDKNFQTLSTKETVPFIENHDIIDITDTTFNYNEGENSQSVSSKDTVTCIASDGVIDITNTTIYSNEKSLFDSPYDDVQIISYTDKNKPIEYITISDDSDEEITQQTIGNSIKSIPIKEPIGIPTQTLKRKYNSPLHKNKKMLGEKNISSNNILSCNFNAFVIDKQSIPQHLLQNNSQFKRTNTMIYKQQQNKSASISNTAILAKKQLRPIIIDGLNIGHAHGCGTFSVKGIELCIQYFTNRGHKKIIAFIPQHWTGPPGSESNTILNALYKKGHICYTPSRKVQNLRMTCYDDRILLDYAHQCGGVVVSNDNYRDLYEEKETFKDIIENRQVMVTFVSDEIIVPDDQYNRKCDVRSLSDILCFPG